MESVKKFYIGASVIYILFGLALLLWPTLSLQAVCYLIGILIFLTGALNIWGFWRKRHLRIIFDYFGLIFGIVTVAVGLFFLLKPEIIIELLPICVGLFIIFDGIVRLQTSITLKTAGFKEWWYLLILSVISVILGIIMIVNPFSMAILVMAIGGILLVEGILNLGATIYASAVLKRITKEMEALTEGKKKAADQDVIDL